MTNLSKQYLKRSIQTILIIFIGCLNVNASITTSYETNSDSTLIVYLQENNIELTNNNELKLLKSGEEKFIDLFNEIEKAKHHIHLEYFNFRNDSIANSLFELLERKVKEGVEVRALFDAFGNSSNNQPLKKKHLKAIREKGI